MPRWGGGNKEREKIRRITQEKRRAGKKGEQKKKKKKLGFVSFREASLVRREKKARFTNTLLKFDRSYTVQGRSTNPKLQTIISPYFFFCTWRRVDWKKNREAKKSCLSRSLYKINTTSGSWIKKRDRIFLAKKC